jgi:putative transposase
MLLRQGDNMNSKTVEISEELWSVAEKVIPAPIFKGKRSLGGRPNLDLRQILTGVFYVLTSGCQWRKLPREFGHHSVVYKYFRYWVRVGIFDQIWTEALRVYDDKKGINWTWQSIDGSNKKSQFGKENVDFNPKEKNKGGSKIMLLTDKQGIPL